MTNTYYHVDSEVFQTLPSSYAGRVTEINSVKDFDVFYDDFQQSKRNGLSDIDAINDAK